MRALAQAFVMTISVAALPYAVSGCETESPVVVVDEVVAAACGTCIYRIPSGQGCYWVVEIAGKLYPVAGKLPHNHDNHAPEGMCNMPRQVKLSGEIRGENFIASKFELLPAEGVPEKPAYTRADIH